ncbi:MAG: ABC transporter permease [Methanotrichaceae archaeon]|nr:ABC transporter permease [Methanotrichaceae archaeon]
MFEYTIARRHIIANPKLVFFAILSVALAIGVIVVMMGLLEGYRSEIITSTVENNPHLTIGPKQNEDYITLYRTLSGFVWSYPEVVAVSPRLIGKAAGKHMDKVSGISFIGADPLLEAPLLEVEEDMVYGTYYDLIFKRRSAILGTKLAEKLEIKPGDQLKLVRQNKSIDVEVVGLITTGTGSDQTLVYLPLKTAQELIDKNDVVTQIGVGLSDLQAAPYIASELNSRTSYEAKSWQNQNRDILQTLDTQRVMMVIFYALIFLIAGVGVANTMIMMVKRRTKEIGILMAMGANNRSILKIFLTESVILGPPAALLGCVLAYLTAKLIEMYPIEVPSDVYMVSRMSIALSPRIFVYAVFFSLVINFLAGLFPAYKAANLDPVEAIAGE